MSTPDTPFYPMTHDDALALIAALEALNPGPADSAKQGFMGPAAYLANGLILEASEARAGLMSAGDKAKLNAAEALVFTAGRSLTQNAGFHNSIYRGKNLGSSVTAAQYAAIGAGTFDDLFIGDYWSIGGVTWRIAAFDYWFGYGDGGGVGVCNTHHIVIVPDENLNNADGSTAHWMNASDTTVGAYVGSDWRTGNNGNGGRAECISKINSAFGSGHILTYRGHLQNAITNPSGSIAYESAGTWYDCTVEIMNERMVYGCDIFHNVMASGVIPNLYSIDHSQLPLFRLNHRHICNRAAWWLRDVVSTAYFAGVGSIGGCGSDGASNPWVGVRPAFGIRA